MPEDKLEEAVAAGQYKFPPPRNLQAELTADNEIAVNWEATSCGETNYKVSLHRLPINI